MASTDAVGAAKARADEAFKKGDVAVCALKPKHTATIRDELYWCRLYAHKKAPGAALHAVTRTHACMKLHGHARCIRTDSWPAWDREQCGQPLVGLM
jgi:hypothetical protein